MSSQLLALSGLSILAVVVNHAGGWGYYTLFWWREGELTVPNYDQVGTWFYYYLVALKQLTAFAVPSFLFISAFFVAYAARGSQSTLTWQMALKRVTGLMVPYVIWSILISVGNFLVGVRYSPWESLTRIITGQVAVGYFYLPLLCQLYLLSPILVPLAKHRSKSLLCITALIHVGLTSLYYLDAFQVPIRGIYLLINLSPMWFFPRLLFFFAFGLVCCFHLEDVRRWLARFRWQLVLATVVLGLSAIVEAEIVTRMTGREWRQGVFFFSFGLYAFCFILCFLAFDTIPVPFSDRLAQLGTKTLGIYLLHSKALDIIAMFLILSAPWVLSVQPLFQLMLIIFALAVPLLLMRTIARSPARSVYRQLFG